MVLAGLLFGGPVGLALGVAVYRRPRARTGALNVCGLILTVPSLALYALLLALLGLSVGFQTRSQPLSCSLRPPRSYSLSSPQGSIGA